LLCIGAAGFISVLHILTLFYTLLKKQAEVSYIPKYN